MMKQWGDRIDSSKSGNWMELVAIQNGFRLGLPASLAIPFDILERPRNQTKLNLRSRLDGPGVMRWFLNHSKCYEL